MGDSFTMRAIGTVRCARAEPIDDDWDRFESVVALDPAQFGASALQGLDEFSHVEIVYLFHRVDPAAVRSAARRPRGNYSWPEVGIFAQRAKGRPNRIGVTRCRLVGVDGLEIRVAGLDAIDGTPVLDVKPHMQEFEARGPVSQPAWSRELMEGYW
jgi:tRNA-Thr(GGU) m(6)t(6)A37 methyltransferase TsaA